MKGCGEFGCDASQRFSHSQGVDNLGSIIEAIVAFLATTQFEADLVGQTHGNFTGLF